MELLSPLALNPSFKLNSPPNKRLQRKMKLFPNLTILIEPDLTEILPNFLFLSDKTSAGDYGLLRAKCIGNVVNCSTSVPNYFENVDKENVLFQSQIEVYTEDQHKKWQNFGFEESETVINYHNVKITDESSERNAQKLLCEIEDAVNFIESSKLRKEKVLVHCSMGMSRSSTIVLAYLMIKENFNLKQAFLLVKQRRRQVRPNESFMELLLHLELKFYGENSLSFKAFKELL